MQKSTKIADSWQGSKNQNRSSFADWYTLVSLQTLCSFFFERSIRFREKRRKPFQAPPSISQAKNRVEIHHDSLDSRSNTAALGKKLVAKILSLTRRWSKYVLLHYNSLSNYKKAKAYDYLMFSHERSLKTATIFIMCLWSEFFQIEGKYTTGIKRLCYVKIILGKSFWASQKLFENRFTDNIK